MQISSPGFWAVLLDTTFTVKSLSRLIFCGGLATRSSCMTVGTTCLHFLKDIANIHDAGKVNPRANIFA